MTLFSWVFQLILFPLSLPGLQCKLAYNIIKRFPISAAGDKSYFQKYLKPLQQKFFQTKGIPMENHNINLH